LEEDTPHTIYHDTCSCNVVKSNLPASTDCTVPSKPGITYIHDWAIYTIGADQSAMKINLHAGQAGFCPCRLISPPRERRDSRPPDLKNESHQVDPSVEHHGYDTHKDVSYDPAAFDRVPQFGLCDCWRTGRFERSGQAVERGEGCSEAVVSARFCTSWYYVFVAWPRDIEI
jgi:hypothetical protein